MFFHYVLVLTSCCSVFYLGFKAIGQKQNIRINFSFPVIISLILIAFPFVCLLFTRQIENYFTSHYIAVFVLFIVLSVCFSNNLINKSSINKFLVYFAVCESVVCFVQFFGFSTADKIFAISGTNDNPNIAAMFLVMVFPAVIEDFKQRNKYISIFISIILIAALILLKSRTAYIGLVVLTITYSIYYLSKINKILVYICVIFCIAGVVIFAPKLYGFKQNSADGRLFVWKVSTQMIAEKPLGYGYGMTQGAYNAAQAHYFETRETTKTEQQNAGYTHHILNDYIEMAVQGGIAGGLLYLAFIVSLIYFGLRQKKKPVFALSGIIAFAAMGLTNFAFYSVFAAMVFVFYAASSTQSTRITRIKRIYTDNKIIRNVLLFVVLVAVICISLQIRSQFILTKINENLKEKDFANAKILTNKTFHFVGSSELYYRSLGNVYLSDKDYITAKSYYEQARKFAPFPEIIMRKAYCEMQVKNYEQAEGDLILAANIQPALFQPHYSLMMLYLQTKNFRQAKVKAEYILEKDVKIPSEKVDYYKEQAKKLKIEN